MYGHGDVGSDGGRPRGVARRTAIQGERRRLELHHGRVGACDCADGPGVAGYPFVDATQRIMRCIISLDDQQVTAAKPRKTNEAARAELQSFR